MASRQDSVASELENTITAIFAHVNVRSFDASSRPWTRIAASYEVHHGHFMQKASNTKSEMISGLRTLTQENPAFYIRILNMSTCIVGERAREAQVFVDSEGDGREVDGCWTYADSWDGAALNGVSSVAVELETIVADCMASYNARDYDPQAPGWKSVAEFFSMDEACPGMRRPAQSKADLLKQLNVFTTAYPALEVRILSFDSQVNEAIKEATVFMHMQNTGGPAVPLGMSKKSTTIFRFRRLDGQWMLIGETTIPGIDLEGD